MIDQDILIKKLDGLRAERARRFSAMLADKDRIAMLSSLRAAAELDGQPIEQLDAEIAELEKQVTGWDDIAAMLDQRIADCHVAIKEGKIAGLLAEYNELQAQEDQRRIDHATALVALAEAEFTLTSALEERQILALNLAEMGVRVEGVNRELGDYPRGRYQTPEAVKKCKQFLAKVSGTTFSQPPLFPAGTVVKPIGQKGWQADGLPEPIRNRAFSRQ